VLLGAAGSGTALAARLLAAAGRGGCAPGGCGVGAAALRETGRAWWCPPVRPLPGAAAHPGVCSDPTAAAVLPGPWSAAVVVVRHPMLAARTSSRDHGWELAVGLALWERTTRLLLAGLAGRSVLVVAHESLESPEFVRAVQAMVDGTPGPDLPVPAAWLAPVEPPRSALDVYAALRAALGRHHAFSPPSLSAEPGWVEARLVAYAASQQPPLPDPMPITTSVVGGDGPLPPWAERVGTPDLLRARGGVLVDTITAAPEDGVDRLAALRRGVVADTGGRPVSVVLRGGGPLLAETCGRLLAGIGPSGDLMLADVTVSPFADRRLLAVGRGMSATVGAARQDVIVVADTGVEPMPGWRAVVSRGVAELTTGVLASTTARPEARSAWRADPPHGLLAVRADVLAAVGGLDDALDHDPAAQQSALRRRVVETGLRVVVDPELRAVLTASSPAGRTGRRAGRS
jgi:hypothetical protein